MKADPAGAEDALTQESGILMAVRVPDPFRAAYPRPTYGILLAITVMNSTLASGGSSAM